MARNPNGEGSFFRYDPSTWVAEYEVDGRRKRLTAADETELRKKLDKLDVAHATIRYDRRPERWAWMSPPLDELGGNRKKFTAATKKAVIAKKQAFVAELAQGRVTQSRQAKNVRVRDLIERWRTNEMGHTDSREYASRANDGWALTLIGREFGDVRLRDLPPPGSRTA